MITKIKWPQMRQTFSDLTKAVSTWGHFEPDLNPAVPVRDRPPSGSKTSPRGVHRCPNQWQVHFGPWQATQRLPCFSGDQEGACFHPGTESHPVEWTKRSATRSWGGGQGLSSSLSDACWISPHQGEQQFWPPNLWTVVPFLVLLVSTMSAIS